MDEWITGEEFERRVRRVSQMRALVHELRQGLMEKYERGELDFKPHVDIRTDRKYWEERLRAKTEAEGVKR